MASLSAQQRPTLSTSVRTQTLRLLFIDIFAFCQCKTYFFRLKRHKYANKTIFAWLHDDTFRVFEAKNMACQIRCSGAAVIALKNGLLTQMGRFVANKRHCVIRWLPQRICLPSTASGFWLLTYAADERNLCESQFWLIRLDCASLALLIFLEMWVKIHSRIAYAGRCQCGYQ